MHLCGMQAQKACRVREPERKKGIMAVKIDEASCLGCGVCADTCPAEALTVDDVAKVDPDACVECGACIDECPVGAISL